MLFYGHKIYSYSYLKKVEKKVLKKNGINQTNGSSDFDNICAGNKAMKQMVIIF